MRHLGSLAGLVGAAVVCGAAGRPEEGVLFHLAGLAIAVLVLLGLPAGLLLHGWRPDWIDATARAVDRRKTVSMLVGAGLLLATALVTVALLGFAFRHPRFGWIAVVPIALGAAGIANFLVGFAGCARRQGERVLVNREGVRPLVLGWLMRAGAFAVPILWPVIGCYLVVLAFGAPLVALLDRKTPEPPAA